jgi:hypothetical protein
LFVDRQRWLAKHDDPRRGFARPYIVGSLAKKFHSTGMGFNALGTGMLVCAGLAFLLPKSKRPASRQPI